MTLEDIEKNPSLYISKHTCLKNMYVFARFDENPLMTKYCIHIKMTIKNYKGK